MHICVQKRSSGMPNIFNLKTVKMNTALTKFITFGSRTQAVLRSCFLLMSSGFVSLFQSYNMADSPPVLSCCQCVQLAVLDGKQPPQAPHWWMRQHGWKVKNVAEAGVKGAERILQPPLEPFITRVMLNQHRGLGWTFHVLDLQWCVALVPLRNLNFIPSSGHFLSFKIHLIQLFSHVIKYVYEGLTF